MADPEHRSIFFSLFQRLFLKSSLLRPALIFFAFTAGGLIPSAASFAWLTRYLLMAMLFLIFLRVKFERIRPRPAHWRLLAANLLIAFTAWLIVRLLTGSDMLAQTAFFTGACPTAAAAPVIMGFLGGSAEFVLTSFFVTNLGVSAALTGLIPLVTGQMTCAFLLQVARDLLLVIGVPMLCAVVLRKCFPSLREKAIEKTNGVSFLMWIGMLFLAAASASAFIRNTPDASSAIFWQVAVISAVLCIINFSCGFFLAGKRCRREASQSLGQKNTMLLICLALAFAGPIPALGPTFYILWHNLWNAAQMYFHDRKR